jgi:[acyl-carrier-protein] S-malonyltransferase
MKVAWLFPGQGSQEVGMGRAVAGRFASAGAAFAAADRALGEPISKLCFEGPINELTLTANTQPALVATSSALVAALRERWPDLPPPLCAAGHSLGEYSALVASGALSIDDAIRIARVRGTAMQAAVPPGVGAMAAIMGIDDAGVSALCDEAAQGEIVSPANFNAPGQIVVAGHAGAVARARELAAARGGKAIALKVSAPFHCALMRPAADRLAAELDNTRFAAPTFPVVANVDAEPNTDPARVASLLVRQVDGAVKWAKSIEHIAALGVTHALEIGPGKVLAGLVKRIAKQITVLSVSDVEGVERAHEFLSQAR